jgi:predicted DNA-binding ribbon-helix-helix protein
MTLKKHSLTLNGHRTSLSLEDEFWNGLQAIAKKQKRPLQDLIEEIDRTREGNLSSAIRVFVLRHAINHKA